MSIFYHSQLDFNFIESLSDTYNVTLDIDQAIEDSTDLNSLISNLISQAIEQINEDFLNKLQDENFKFLTEKRLDELQDKLQESIFVNSLDSHNSLDYVCNDFFTPKELEKIEEAGININFYSL